MVGRDVSRWIDFSLEAIHLLPQAPDRCRTLEPAIPLKVVPSLLPPPTHLALLIADNSVEFFAFQAQEVVSRGQNATFGGDGPGCVDIITGHHSDSNASPSAFGNCRGYLRGAKRKRRNVVMALVIRGPPGSVLGSVKTEQWFCLIVFIVCSVPLLRCPSHSGHLHAHLLG